MTLAFSYVRFSSDRQQHGSSVERQVESARQYALAHGLTLDESTYRDLGVSAFRSKNRVEGALGAFIQAVDDGKIPSGSYLLIESFDRLSRDTVDTALELFLNITRKGITIVTLMDGQVYSKKTIRENWTKLIMALAVMARANEESVTKSRRVKESYERRKQRGEIAHGKYPSWLRKADKKTFEVIPERAALINRIFDMALQGLGSRLIARQLVQDDIKTFQWATEWNQALVSGLLRSPAVYGCKGDDESYYPPIMSKEKFMMTVSAVKGRTWKGGRVGVPNLFAGLGYCAICGSRVRYIPSGEGTPHVKCKQAVDHFACVAKNYPYKPCELAFMYTLCRKTKLDISGEYIAEQSSKAPALQAEIETLKQRQSQLLKLAALAQGVEAVAEALNAIQKQINALEDEFKSLDKHPLSKPELSKYNDLFNRYLIASMATWKKSGWEPDENIRVPLNKAKHGIDTSPEAILEIRRKIKLAMNRIFRKIEFGVGKEGWEPTLTVTLVDGGTITIDVVPFLPKQSLRRQKQQVVRTPTEV